MALKPCRECGEEVSSEARICPKCGITKPVPKEPSPILKWIVVIFGLWVFGILVFGGESKGDKINHAAVMADIEKFVHALANSDSRWEKVEAMPHNDYHNISFTIYYKNNAVANYRWDTQQLVEKIKNELLRKGINPDNDGISIAVHAAQVMGKNEHGESIIWPMGFTMYVNDTEQFYCDKDESHWEKC